MKGINLAIEEFKGAIGMEISEAKLPISVTILVLQEILWDLISIKNAVIMQEKAALEKSEKEEAENGTT